MPNRPACALSRPLPAGLLGGLLGLLAASCGPLDPSDGPPDPAPPAAVEEATTGWSSIGYGVNYRGSGGAGSNVFIAYAGYNVGDAQAEAWTDALYAASLSRLGVGHLYAVRGPADVTYTRREIGNSKLIAHLLGRMDAGTRLIAIASHSSGSYVANELFGELWAGRLDPTGKTTDRIVYYNLDGASGITADDVGHIRRTFFVHAHDGRTGTDSPNAGGMISLGGAFGARAGGLTVAADGDGCSAGAPWCLHMTLVTSRPHNPATSDPRDYSDFAGRPVQTSYLTQTWALLTGLSSP